ncbi:MAG: NAD(P)/FAD-dependent oxidoreductase [Gammaproteobacteria bacterium]
MEDYDVIVIGGGAAGLMCALVAGQRGRRVLIVECANRIGKKILMSGGGRCNFTNLYVEPDRFLSANPHFCKSALSRYTQWDFISKVEQHGIAYHEKSQGQLFCDTSSRAIVEMLQSECLEAGVRILTRCATRSVSAGRPFELSTSAGEFSAPSLVVASGGLSIPKMGGSAFGYELARQFGHQVLPTRAGLVPFAFTDEVGHLAERLSGVSLSAKIRTGDQSFEDDILFTHRGLSGPAVLQLSSYWHHGTDIHLNLLPTISVPDWLLSEKASRPRAALRTVISKHLPRRLVAELEPLWWEGYAETPMAQLTDSFLWQLAQQLGDWRVRPAGTEGYRTAEVTLGGVDTQDLSSKTMESLRQPGLYFIGEVVDVTGHLGGFNFQWAWSSGVAAGEVV